MATIKKLLALEGLIACLGRLPGVGRRSAERMAYALMMKRDGLARDLAMALTEASTTVCCCSLCGGFTAVENNPCVLCTDPSRDASILCVVEEPSDVLLIEKSGTFQGRYHVLMGKLSPMRGVGAGQLRMEFLARRVAQEPIREIILALNSDMESDATAGFIRDMLAGHDARISRPALGLPAGSGVAYSDAVTLAGAFKARQPL